MTPAAQTAQKREEAIALIRAHAPTRLQDALIELLRPAIALSATRAEDAQIPLGASKFGGAPDVPPGFEWPMWNDKPLGFLAQINLEEVAAFDAEELLPKSGLLSFFIEYSDDQDLQSNSEDANSWRVCWFETSDLVRVKAIHKVAWEVASIEVEAQWNFSTDVPPDFDFALEGEEDQWYRYLDEFPINHKIFGYPDEIGHSPAVDCETALRGLRAGYQQPFEQRDGIKQSSLDWKLLFQVVSDNELGVSWCDWGRLFFMIRSEDLTARRFDKVGFSFQSH